MPIATASGPPGRAIAGTVGKKIVFQSFPVISGHFSYNGLLSGSGRTREIEPSSGPDTSTKSVHLVRFFAIPRLGHFPKAPHSCHP